MNVGSDTGGSVRAPAGVNGAPRARRIELPFMACAQASSATVPRKALSRLRASSSSPRQWIRPVRTSREYRSGAIRLIGTVQAFLAHNAYDFAAYGKAYYGANETLASKKLGKIEKLLYVRHPRIHIVLA
jgi:hypothetical protein